jgi:hypothetical protein
MGGVGGSSGATRGGGRPLPSRDSPARIRSSVLLPAPLSPTRSVRLPVGREKEMLCSTILKPAGKRGEGPSVAAGPPRPSHSRPMTSRWRVGATRTPRTCRRAIVEVQVLNEERRLVGRL